MSNSIHPSAIIGKNVQMGQSNVVGPGCVIDDDVVFGSHNRLWMNVYIGPGTTLGNNNQIHMGAVIGHIPQDLTYDGAASFTKIGNNNTFREYVTIHRGTKENTATAIGDENIFMASAHAGHNCTIGNKVIIVNLVSLAGYCVVEDGALLSGTVVVHQFTCIGRLAMVSGLSAVNKDVPPFMLAGGRPAVIQGLNAVGMRRAGIDAKARQDIKQVYKLLYREGLNVPHALEAIDKQCGSAEAKAIADFIRASKRGICAGIGAELEEGEEPESILPRKPRQQM